MSKNPERKLLIGYIYGLYAFDRDGDCERCHERDRKLNKVGHCEPCQDELDGKAGVKRQ